MSTLTRDGSQLHFDDTGRGAPPIVFVHGFGGGGRRFAAQVEHFADRHRVVTVDRRGHGRSRDAAGPYSIAQFADDLAWVGRELGLHRPVVVVHSMGAIGLELAHRHPDALSALVLLDTPLFAPPPVIEAFRGLGAALRTPHWADAVRGMAEQVAFAPTDDPARKAELLGDTLATPQEALAGSWESFLAYDPAPALAACRVPLACIQATMPIDRDRVAALRPGVMFGETLGSGHYHQVFAAAQVSAMIERFLTLARPPAA